MSKVFTLFEQKLLIIISGEHLLNGIQDAMLLLALFG